MSPAAAVAEARAPRARAPHLRLVTALPRRRVRLAATLTVAVGLLAVFGLVGFHVFVVQTQFELERLEAEVVQEQEQFERLRLEVARLSSPDRVLGIARDELGMVEPDRVTYLAVRESLPGDESKPAARAWAEVKPHLVSRR